MESRRSSSQCDKCSNVCMETLHSISIFPVSTTHAASASCSSYRNPSLWSIMAFPYAKCFSFVLELKSNELYSSLFWILIVFPYILFLPCFANENHTIEFNLHTRLNWLIPLSLAYLHPYFYTELLGIYPLPRYTGTFPVTEQTAIIHASLCII